MSESPEEFYTNLLGIGDPWEVRFIKRDSTNKEVIVTVALKGNTPLCCLVCGKPAKLHDHRAFLSDRGLSPLGRSKHQWFRNSPRTDMADQRSGKHLMELLVYWCGREKLATASKLDKSLSIEADYHGREDGTPILLGNSECHTAQGKQKHAGGEEYLYSTHKENCLWL